jgi:myosin heavy subunit
MSTLNNIFAKFSAQEPMKVEFAPQSQVLAAKMQSLSDETVMTQKTLDKKIDDLQFVKQDSKEYAQKASQILNGSNNLMQEGKKAMDELSSLGKELGISENEIPEWRILAQRVEDLKSKAARMGDSLKSLNNEL